MPYRTNELAPPPFRPHLPLAGLDRLTPQLTLLPFLPPTRRTFQSGDIDLGEWLSNLSKLPGLQAAITQALDPVTGKVSTYRSLEEQVRTY